VATTRSERSCGLAAEGEVDPDRLSFTRSLRAARRSVRRTVDDLTTGLRHVSAEILHELLPTGAYERSLALCAPR